MDEVLPNRNKFIDDLFHANDLYNTVLPTQSPAKPPSPTDSPTASPTFRSLSTPSPSSSSSSCADSPLRFRTEKPNGAKISRDCSWVANKSTNLRCSWEGVSSICPVTCDSCEPCRDSSSRFRLTYNGKKITRDCTWVGNKATKQRCKSFGVTESCRETCGVC